MTEESTTALPSPQQSEQDEEFTSTLTTLGAVEPTVDDVENARRASSELSIDRDNIVEPLDMPISEQRGVAEQSSAGKLLNFIFHKAISGSFSTFCVIYLVIK